jgi:nucleotide-binding universal stress UspA family protein
MPFAALRMVSQEDRAVGLFERLGFPAGRAAKVIDGQHPEPGQPNGNAPKPDMLPLTEGEDGQRIQTKRNVLVAISGKKVDDEVVSLACTLAKAKKVNVYVVYGIEVPRKLALDDEMPQETQAANEALDRAAYIAEQLHVRIQPEILQSRNFGQSLVDEAAAHECSLLVVGLPYQLGLGGHFDLGNTVDYVLKNAPCRVWTIRGQRCETGGAESAKTTRQEAMPASR